MNDYLSFRVSTNLKSLLGRGLVTDQIAAVFELVKNSYDADAETMLIEFKNMNTPNASIVIQDNGSGMSLEDIQNKWMVVGTDSKKNQLYSPIYNRPLNGDKGIGRFSVDRLGSRLHLESIARNSTEKIIMNFDWDEFDDEYKEVGDIKIPYFINKVPINEKGVTLVISGLRDEWTENSVKSLIKNLRQFKSPFSEKDNFDIFIDAEQFGYSNYEIVPEKLENVSSLWIEAECKENEPDIIYQHIVKDGLDYYETVSNPFHIGPLRARVYFFSQGDKIRFKNRYSVRVREFGNIRLYRNDFRIHPYGEENNDWLDIDRRHAQGFARTFSSRDIIGYIQTYKEKNVGLIPLTNRQGLIENDDFNSLKKFVTDYTIKLLEHYYFNKFKKGRNETLDKSKKDIDSSIKTVLNLTKEVSKKDKELGNSLRAHVEVIKREHAKQLQYAKDQQEIAKVYSRIAQKETFLHQLIHQTMLDLRNARNAIELLEDFEGFNLSGNNREFYDTLKKNLESAFSKMMTVRDDVSRIREKRTLDIFEEIKSCMRDNMPQLEANDIELDMPPVDDVTYYMDSQDLHTILNNLVSNSIKSLKDVHDRKRKLEIKVKKNNAFVVIQVTDNGVGIDEELRERIFDPFFTTTEEQGGLGLGLTIVDEMLKEYSGVLELADIVEQGACFLIKLKK